MSSHVLVVGLGNPLPGYAERGDGDYTYTRHNVGALLADALAAYVQGSGGMPTREQCESVSRDFFYAKSFQALQYDVAHGKDILWHILKPQTYMNLSGSTVAAALHFYKVPLSHVLVLSDDVDQAFGNMRLRVGGGHGGHNGIRNILECTKGQGSTDFSRTKIGVGRPEHPQYSVADWVLGRFTPEELDVLYKTMFPKALQKIQSRIAELFPKS